ncbi:MAG: hypothetical protein RLZZ182_2450 [Pseudomonadota bacterium]|jgi:hypothetical protein
MSQTPATQRTCLVETCGRTVDRHQLLCQPHFKLLPPQMADNLYFTWALSRRPNRQPQQVRCQGYYEAARNRALQHIEEATNPSPITTPKE